jgi:hypothetical protein
MCWYVLSSRSIASPHVFGAWPSMRSHVLIAGRPIFGAPVVDMIDVSDLTRHGACAARV